MGKLGIEKLEERCVPSVSGTYSDGVLDITVSGNDYNLRMIQFSGRTVGLYDINMDGSTGTCESGAGDVTIVKLHLVGTNEFLDAQMLGTLGSIQTTNGGYSPYTLSVTMAGLPHFQILEFPGIDNTAGIYPVNDDNSLGSPVSGHSDVTTLDLTLLVADGGGTSSGTGLQDASFETHTLSSNSYVTAPTDTPWLYHGPAGVSTRGTAYYSGSNPAAPDGSNVAFLQGMGSLIETFTLSSGGTFNVSMKVAQLYPGGTYQQDFCVFMDGTELTDCTPTTTGFLTYTTNNITLAAGTHTLTLTGLASYGSSYVALIDQLALNAA